MLGPVIQPMFVQDSRPPGLKILTVVQGMGDTIPRPPPEAKNSLPRLRLPARTNRPFSPCGTEQKAASNQGQGVPFPLPGGILVLTHARTRPPKLSDSSPVSAGPEPLEKPRLSEWICEQGGPGMRKLGPRSIRQQKTTSTRLCPFGAVGLWGLVALWARCLPVPLPRERRGQRLEACDALCHRHWWTSSESFIPGYCCLCASQPCLPPPPPTSRKVLARYNLLHSS